MNTDEVAKLLIEIVLDKKEGEEVRSDALLDLQDHNYYNIGDALLEVINDIDENFDMRHDACETLAAVMNNQDKFDRKIFNSITPEMKDIVKMFTLAIRPDWASFFDEKLNN